MAAASGHIIVRRKPANGKDGKRGAIIRGPQLWNDIEDGFYFEAGGENDTYLDLMTIDGSVYYKCKVSHTKPHSPNSLYLNTYWEEYPKVSLVATDLLLSKDIIVERLTAGNIEMRDSQGNILFKAKNGDVECNTGTFTNIKVVGTSRSPFVFAEQASQWELEGEDPNELDTNDNIVIPSTYSLNPLPYTPDQSGRRITIVCYKWGNAEYGNGNTLTAPSGKFFYEHGIKKQSISLSREYVELLGYGDPNNFYGWIVTNRRNISTEYSYGRPFNVLAQGLVTVNSQGTPSISARVFDKSAMSVSRADGGVGNGHFRINFNSNWFQSASDYLVMLTPYGKTNGRQYDTLATLISRDISSFRVNTLDVDGHADGGFEFLITNMNDWKDYNEW